MSLYLTPLSFILFLKRRVKRRVWLDLREVELPVLLRAGKEKRWMEYEGLVVRRLSQMKRAKRPKGGRGGEKMVEKRGDEEDCSSGVGFLLFKCLAVGSLIGTMILLFLGIHAIEIAA
nr:hypothetical protein Itr_chr01CG16200 [Ipomoea trifida]